MAKRRDLQLRPFLMAISPNTLLRYFEKSAIPDAGQKWLHMNPDSVLQFVADPANAEVAELILDDLERLAQLCRDGVALIVRTYRKFGLSFDESSSPQELAMLLFLDHVYAFEYARSRFLLYGGGSTLSVFRLKAEHVETGPAACDAFKSDVRAWFAAQAKGEACAVNVFEDNQELVILIQRGTYLQTLPVWEASEITVKALRPAIEDVLTFDQANMELRIKTPLASDRDNYIRLFARHFAGAEALADTAMREAMFSLEPVRKGEFNFGGRGAIRAIDLVGIKLKLNGPSRPVLTLRADEVRDALKYDLKGMTLTSGELLAVTFRFHVQAPGEKRATQLTFRIQPPERTDIGERRYAPLVLEYLRRQGVKLQ